ncbi:MAG: cytochrome B6 [Methylococcales bacterium]|nr:cytochrome B6 [Methylococcales bacterium]MBT7408672.1 cytochrome B6 [Methylococcales bacterium]
MISLNVCIADYRLIAGKEPILPIPNVKITNQKKVDLGKKLFHDVRLSANNTFSCATCHSLENAGVDHLKVAVGILGRKGLRNTPTVYNSSLHFRQFWDGRVKSLEEQAAMPITNPLEMGSTWKQVLAKLSKDKDYKKAFSALYDAGVNKENILDAIAEFERTLLTPNSPFDLYLKGDKTAVNEATKKGYHLFKSYGCSSCHQGVAVGANLYEKLGVVIHYKPHDIDPDPGRFKQTMIDEHRHEFKVPSLRNIELTAPYLHDGSIGTLEEVVSLMGKYQLGRVIPSDDISSIVLFLKSLTALPLK